MIFKKNNVIPLFTVVGLCCSVFVPQNANAAAQMSLNLVWARLADVNGEEGSIESAEFSPDSRFIVTGSKFDNQVIMWRTSDGTEIWRREIPEEIENVVFSPDGKWVASISEDFMLNLFRASDGHLDWSYEHTQGIDGIAWSHDGKILATGEESVGSKTNGKLRLFRMPERRLIRTADHGWTIDSLDFTQDDQFLISVGGKEVNLWRTADMSLVRTYTIDSEFTLVTGRISPDGQYVVASGFGGTIYLWRFSDGELVKKFNHTGKKVEIVDFSPNGQYLFTAGHDRSIFIYRLDDILSETRIPIAYKSEPTDNAEYLAFNASGGLLASAHQDGVVRLWVFMSDDPKVNSRRHKAVLDRQRKAAERRAAERKK